MIHGSGFSVNRKEGGKEKMEDEKFLTFPLFVSIISSITHRLTVLTKLKIPEKRLYYGQIADCPKGYK